MLGLWWNFQRTFLPLVVLENGEHMVPAPGYRPPLWRILGKKLILGIDQGRERNTGPGWISWGYDQEADWRTDYKTPDCRKSLLATVTVLLVRLTLSLGLKSVVPAPFLQLNRVEYP